MGPSGLTLPLVPALSTSRGYPSSRLRSNARLWETTEPERLLDSLTITGSAVPLANSRSGLLVSYGDDPQIVLPVMEPREGPVRIDIVLRLVSSFDAVYEALQAHADQKVQAASQVAGEESQRLADDLEAARATIEELTVELRGAQSERMVMAFEMKQAIFDRLAAQRELKRLEVEYGTEVERKITQNRAEIESARRDVEAALADFRSNHEELAETRRQLEETRQLLEGTDRELDETHRQMDATHRQLESANQQLELERQRVGALSSRVVELEADVAELGTALHQEHHIRSGIMGSVSWRVTEPARRFMHILRTALHKR